MHYARSSLSAFAFEFKWRRMRIIEVKLLYSLHFPIPSVLSSHSNSHDKRPVQWHPRCCMNMSLSSTFAVKWSNCWNSSARVSGWWLLFSLNAIILLFRQPAKVPSEIKLIHFSVRVPIIIIIHIVISCKCTASFGDEIWVCHPLQPFSSLIALPHPLTLLQSQTLWWCEHCAHHILPAFESLETIVFALSAELSAI